MNDLRRRGTHTLTIAGKEINLLFNMRFWGLLDEAGYKLETLEEHLDQSKGFVKLLGVFVAILHSAGKSYSLIHKTDWDYSQDEIYDWFEDDIDQEKLQGIMEAMTSSKIMGHSLSSQSLGKPKGKK